MSSPLMFLLVAGVIAAHLALFVAGYHLYVFTIPTDSGQVLQAADAGVFAASDQAESWRFDDQNDERFDGRESSDESGEDRRE